MTSFVDTLRARAAATRPRVVFPESADERTRDAVRRLHAERIVEPVVVLDPGHGGEDPGRDHGHDVRRRDLARVRHGDVQQRIGGEHRRV